MGWRYCGAYASRARGRSRGQVFQLEALGAGDLNIDKAQLLHLRVPWQVSPSTPFLRLVATESRAQEPTQVNFVAHFGLLEQRESSFADVPRISHAPHYDNSAHIASKTAPGIYQLLTITFDSGLWARMSPSFSDREVIDPSLYDRSKLPCPYQRGQSPEDWVHRFWAEWRQTGFCPQSGFYEVNFSPWLEETGYAKSSYKHFIVLGHDAYVEVLAKGWSWKSEGNWEQ